MSYRKHMPGEARRGQESVNGDIYLDDLTLPAWPSRGASELGWGEARQAIEATRESKL
jgi:hypothetical protein